MAVFKRGLIVILLVFSLLLSMAFLVPQVYSATVISHPGGIVIDVGQGENFLFRHRLNWDEADGGYYAPS